MRTRTTTANLVEWLHTGKDGKERLLQHGRTSHITVVTRDKGYGSAKIDKKGRTVLKYKLSAYDEKTLLAGIVQSLRVLIAAGAVEVGTQQTDGERFKAEGKLETQTLTLSVRNL